MRTDLTNSGEGSLQGSVTSLERLGLEGEDEMPGVEGVGVRCLVWRGVRCLVWRGGGEMPGVEGVRCLVLRVLCVDLTCNLI